MPDTEKQEAKLPPFEKTFAIEERGDDGKMYAGDFTIKRLSIGNLGRVGTEIARLNGGNTVDQTTDYINTAIAHFKFAIVKAPDWFDVDKLYEPKVIKKVFDTILEHERSFRPSEDAG